MSANIQEVIPPASMESRSHDHKPSFPSVPGPVAIIEPVEEEHTFKLNEEFLEKILLNPRVADKKVSVIGVAGAFRKGKSFLLNFFLRYLKYRSHSNNATDDWLDSEPSLQGFSWRGGCERDTNGIIAWSEPFIIKDRNGEEIAVLLMDTQGSFDSQSTVKDCATIFALSTMVSSIQIYNVTHNIQEDDLQHLSLFTEYGRLALEDNIDSKPFQSLLFVVRDWSYPYEAEYGYLGGGRVLNRRLEVNEKQHPELQQLRKHIRASFDDIQCFLMPHPGLDVATSPEFKGELKDISSEFQKHLRTLVPKLLDSNNIVVKSINGQPVTCRELVVYFKAYTDIFHGEELPEPKSMLAATAEANNLAAVASAKAYYAKEMEEICGGDAPFMGTAELEAQHLRIRGESIRHFRTAKKMGGTELSLQFLERLDNDINDSFENYKKVNNSKNLFKSMRTPAALVGGIIIGYIIQETLQLLSLDMVASFFTLFIFISILLLSSWTYSRYSGNLREFGRLIDEGVAWTWDNFISPKVPGSVKHGAAAVAASKKYF
ncbi:atlastin-1 [Ditylenchus destructor]|uniref:Atlastin-1 n=1 Tax=Ditylenchus destructor TaxID=166010 RepID=A0AAD4N3T0_9BILA|nr:atlastin-1 [Ditylenchus destructor]